MPGQVRNLYYPGHGWPGIMRHMAHHAGYCPIAVGIDVLGDRWTPLVIRELMVGASGFNEIHRGIPRISRTMLAQRLRLLQRRGLVHCEPGPRGRPGSYTLTSAGESVTPVIWAIGHWAAEWIFPDPTDEDCDGLSLMWSLHKQAITAKLPPQRTVLHLRLTGAGAAEGWIDIERGAVSVCIDNPGYDVALAIEADTKQMHRWLVGLVPFRHLVANGHARVLGPSRLARAFPTWFDTSYFAEDLRRARLRHQQDAVPA